MQAAGIRLTALPWRVILGGVDTEKFSPDWKLWGSEGVLFVGRLLPHKGVSDLIASLPERMPLDIIGPVNDPAYLDALARQAAGKTVRFRHDVDDRFGHPWVRYVLKQPIQVVGIWVPTRLEVYSADGHLAAVTRYASVKVNTGLSESLFRL